MSLNPSVPPPQPYGAYAQPHAAAPPPSLQTPALVAQWAFGIATGLYVLALPVTIWSFALLADAETVFTGAMVAFAVALLTAAGMIFGAVAFIIWLFRARTVADPYDQRLEWKRGWTIGAWMIPIANYFLPLLVVGEITRHAQDRSARGGTRAMFYLWATSWTIYLVLNQVSSLTTLGDTEATGPIAISGGVIGLDVVTTIALTVAGVAGIRLIRQTTADLENPAGPPQVPMGAPVNLG